MAEHPGIGIRKTVSDAASGAPKSWDDKEGTPKRIMKKRVFMQGYVETNEEGHSEKEGSMKFTKNLTEEDLEELKGCADLGFAFNYQDIPKLLHTLPALELCYSMTQNLEKMNSSMSSSIIHVVNWKIVSPGDHPDDVKTRLRFWAKAVSCTMRLCR